MGCGLAMPSFRDLDIVSFALAAFLAIFIAVAPPGLKPSHTGDSPMAYNPAHLFNDGADAQLAGYASTSNPYAHNPTLPGFTQRAKDWSAGFDAAARGDLTRETCERQMRILHLTHGFHSLGDMLDIVINKGFCGQSATTSRDAWAKLERDFHTAQMWLWASLSDGQERAKWTACAKARAA